VPDRSLPRQSRTSNLTLVLQLILSEGPVSRADIARTTGLNPTTVSSLVVDLTDDGLIEEVGTAASSGGKPPTQLAVRASAVSLVAIDLSSQPMSAALVDLAGTITRRVVAPSAGARGEEAVKVGLEMAETLVGEATAPIVGFGIASPGVVSPGGEVIHSILRGWHGLPIGRIFSERFGLPAHVLNVAHAAAVAEFSNDEVGHDNLMVVLIDVGIGSGLILDGRLYVGDRSGAGEIGHMWSPFSDEMPCDCGAIGCLETVASLPATVRRARRDGYLGGDDWVSIRRALALGEPGVVAAVSSSGSAVGRLLTDVVKLLDIHRVVVAGEISEVGDAFLRPIRAELQSSSNWPDMSAVEVSYAAGGADAPLRGAASVLLHEEFGVLWP
jgi:predicted NBD/HSP70 family sugar kinase